MSIERTGPDKYILQDKACLEVMLRFFEHTEARFFVEPAGGEDGELAFQEDGKHKRIEVQVKGAAPPLGLKELASYLAHFPQDKSEDSLLERLVNDPSVIVALVVSARCLDETMKYRMPAEWNGGIHPPGKFTVKDAQALLGAVGVVTFPTMKDTPLRAKRLSRCAELSRNIEPGKLKEALRRLVILEEVTEASLDRISGERLRTKHRIPGKRIAKLLTLLREDVIRAAKNSHEDAFPFLRESLAKEAPPSIRPRNYIHRGAEAEWLDVLARDFVLLLSGPPRVGKSDAARWVAAEFETEVDEIQEFTTVEEAERYLRSPGDDRRIAVLDDPLGATHRLPGSSRAFSSLSQLVPRLGSTRMLIVAQSQDRLLQASRAISLAEVNTAGHPWRNLGKGSSSFQKAIWDQQAELFDVPAHLRSFIASSLESGELDLEAGCIIHLAMSHTKLLNQSDLAAIARLAYEDAEAFGRSLEEEGFDPEIQVLALASGPGEPLAIRELGFAMGQGGEHLPGVPEEDDRFGVAYSVGAIEDHDIPQIAYQADIITPENTLKKLDNLEMRRIIEIDRAHGAIAFTHPYYRAAAEASVNNATWAAEKRILQFVQRGLFCAAPVTARATSRNLDWVYEVLHPSATARSALVSLAIEGLSSFFPSCRDLCFGFLLRKLPEIDPELKSDLPRWVSRLTDVSLEDIRWIDGEAIYPEGGTLRGPALIGLTDSAAEESAANILSYLDSSTNTYVSPEAAATALEFLRATPSKLTANAIGRFLSFDEAVIRGAAARIWVKVQREDDADVLDRIFSEEHPTVAIGALKGAMDGWHSLKLERQQALLQGLKRQANSPAVTCAAIHILQRFERVEVSRNNPAWPIFEEVLPIVLQNLPESADTMQARLFNVVNTAKTVLSRDAILQILDAGIGLLRRFLDSGRMPEDYLFGLIDILIDVTKNAPEQRGDRITSLLRLSGTGPTIAVIGLLVDRWEELSSIEQDELKRVIASARPDSRWLQASVITRSQPPEALLNLILGDFRLDDTPANLIAGIPAPLLDAAIHTYCGHPQPSWWAGSHRNSQVWDPVVNTLALSPANQLFEVAWKEILGRGNGNEVASLLSTLGPTYSGQIFELMLSDKVRVSGKFMPEAWEALLAQAPDTAVYQLWIERLAELGPTFLDDIDELRDWLNGDNLKAISVYFESDWRLTNHIRKLRNTVGSEELKLAKTEIKTAIETAMESNPPRLHRTYLEIQSFLRSIGIEADGDSQIEKMRQDCLKSKHALSKRFRERFVPMPDWEGR